MTFSVVHRMIAGFSMLAIGLIIIGAIGIRSIVNVGHSVTELVETATPVSQLTSNLVNVLIRSDQTMIAQDPATQTRLEVLSGE